MLLCATNEIQYMYSKKENKKTNTLLINSFVKVIVKQIPIHLSLSDDQT